MPKVLIYETRRLILPLETVVDAVLDLDREQGGKLSMATVTDARIQAGTEAALILEIQAPEALGRERRSYPLPAIAAAVIRYCWKNKVPLPRTWAKSIEIVPEGFALSLHGSVEINRRNAGFSTRTSSPAEPASGETRSTSVSR